MATLGIDASEVDSARAELDELAAQDYDVKVSINQDSVGRIGESIATALTGIQDGDKDVSINVTATGTSASEIQEIADAVNAFPGEAKTVSVSAEVSGDSSKIQELADAFESF